MKLQKSLLYTLIIFLPSQLAIHFWPSWSFVYGLRVDYLSPTLYFTDILALLFILSCVFTKTPRGIFNNILKKNYTWIVALFVLALVNTIFANGTLLTAYKWLKVFEFITLSLFAYSLRITKKETLPFISIALAYSVFLSLLQVNNQGTLGGFWYYLGERSFTSQTPGIALFSIDGKMLLRPYATFPHPNALAAFALLSLLLSFPYKSIASKLIFFLSTLLIILTFSRTIFLLLPASLFLYRQKSIKLLLIFLVTSSFLFSILGHLDLPLPVTIKERLNLAYIAGKLFSEKPIFGSGLGGFVPALPALYRESSIVLFRWWLQPVHNIFLLLVSETGITGLLFFCFSILKLTKKLAGKQSYIIISAILLSSFADHYWLTLQQTGLMLALTLALVKTNSVKIT